MLRCVEYGDYDLIITFFTLKRGKITVIAKSAKKSSKRFGGILELFSVLDIVYSTSKGRQKGLPILNEAALKTPNMTIRQDIMKTAYASYWADLINIWLEEGVRQDHLFHLFNHVLCLLDTGCGDDTVISVLFQIKFLNLSGHSPDLTQCCVCHREIDKVKTSSFIFDLSRGGLICEGCNQGNGGQISIGKGTLKQLQWIKKSDLKTAGRIRFTSRAIEESLNFLEVFVPYHLGRDPKSLKFLRQIRE